MSKKKDEQARKEALQSDIQRIRLPRGAQTFGIIEKKLGAGRMSIRCLDGKTRVCRVPGRLKRRLWTREGDLVIVEPWEFGGDKKGDVVLKYKKTQIDFLRRKGYLNKLDEFEEF